MFTATWPKAVRKLAAAYLRAEPTTLFLGGGDKDVVPAEKKGRADGVGAQRTALGAGELDEDDDSDLDADADAAAVRTKDRAAAKEAEETERRKADAASEEAPPEAAADAARHQEETPKEAIEDIAANCPHHTTAAWSRRPRGCGCRA